MSKQLPCSLVVERALTVAGIERKAILSCGPDQHHIYCPAYYQNLIDDAEAALAELQERPVCDCHTWPTWGEMHSYIEALERKLAECERRIKELDHTYAENVRCEYCGKNKLALLAGRCVKCWYDLERKLAAAREAVAPIIRAIRQASDTQETRLTIQNPSGFVTAEFTIDLAERRALLAALTEAGEGEK